MERTKYDLDVWQELVEIGPNLYVLQEASGAAAVKYRNAAMSGVKMSKGKVVGVENIAEAEPILVAACLCEATPDGGVKLGTTGQPVRVALQTVQAWPARVIKDLFAKIKKHSALDEQDATPEQLREQIEELQERLAELEGDGPKGTTPSRAGSD